MMTQSFGSRVSADWVTGKRLAGIAFLVLACMASRGAAQDESGSPEALGGNSPQDVTDLLADESVLSDLQLNNGQRERVDKIVEEAQKQQTDLSARHAAELEAISSVGERIRRRAAQLREKREHEGRLRDELAVELASVLDERQVTMLEERAQASESSASPTRTTRRTANRDEGRENRRTDADPVRRSADAVASFSVQPETASAEDVPNASTNVAIEPKENISSDEDVPNLPPVEDSVKVAFNFHEARWLDVLRLFTDAAGLTLHMRDTPPGLFTYYDRRSYTPTQALDVMNRYLLQDGFILVRHDQFLTVLDAKKGVPPNLIETVSVDSLADRGETELLRVSFPLGDRDTSTAAAEIRGLLGPQGTVVPLESAGSIIVTDIGANLRDVKQHLEPPPVIPDAELIFQAFPLTHVDAETAADKVKSLFGLQVGMMNVSDAATRNSSRNADRRSRGNGNDRREMMRRFAQGRGGGDDGGRGGAPSSANENERSNNPTTKVTVDRRTNSVLVTAKAEEMKLVAQVIKAIDVPPSNEGTQFDNRGALSEPFLEAYKLETADPQEVAKTLGVLHPGMVVNEDRRARSVHVWATPEQHREIALHIRQLDGGALGEALAVISVEGMNAFEVSQTLTSLYEGDSDGAPSIQYDPAGRGLIVRGSAGQVMQIRSVVAQMAMQDPGESQQRTVRVVPTASPNGQFVGQTISALYPQVTVISTPEVASNATSTSENGRGRSRNRSQDDAERADRIRRWMEMRSRGFGGGGNASGGQRGQRGRGGGGRGGGDGQRSRRGG